MSAEQELEKSLKALAAAATEAKASMDRVAAAAERARQAAANNSTGKQER
jgi:hypothetical protein